MCAGMVPAPPVAGRARYAPAVAILREADDRIGCLAVPISAVAGFIVLALVVAALGASAGAASVAGLIGAVVGVGVSIVMVRRS